MIRDEDSFIGVSIEKLSGTTAPILPFPRNQARHHSPTTFGASAGWQILPAT